jgi:MFS family permease
MSDLVAGVSIEPWAVSLIVVVGSFGGVALALILVGFMTVKYGRRVIDEIRQLTEAVHELDEKVRVVRNTAVPAVATAVGAFGLAITGAVSPWAGAGASVGASLITYVFAACADDPESGRLRALLATAAAMVPILAIFIGLAASGGLSGLSAASLVAFVAVSIIGFTGLMFLVLRASQKDIDQDSAAPGGSGQTQTV